MFACESVLWWKCSSLTLHTLRNRNVLQLFVCHLWFMFHSIDILIALIFNTADVCLCIFSIKLWHLCSTFVSVSFFQFIFFCRYFKKKSTLSCQHEHGAFVGFMNIWIFIYIFWLLFHPDLLDHQRICITFHRLHLRVEVSDGEVFLFPKVYIRCAPS